MTSRHPRRRRSARRATPARSSSPTRIRATTAVSLVMATTCTGRDLRRRAGAVTLRSSPRHLRATRPVSIAMNLTRASVERPRPALRVMRRRRAGNTSKSRGAVPRAIEPTGLEELRHRRHAQPATRPRSSRRCTRSLRTPSAPRAIRRTARHAWIAQRARRPVTWTDAIISPRPRSATAVTCFDGDERSRSDLAAAVRGLRRARSNAPPTERRATVTLPS